MVDAFFLFWLLYVSQLAFPVGSLRKSGPVPAKGIARMDCRGFSLRIDMVWVAWSVFLH